MPRRASSPDLLQPFLALLERKAPRPLTIDEMVRLLGIDRFAPKAIRAGLERAVDGGQLRRIGKTRYQWRRESERGPARRGRAARAGRAVAPGTVRGRYARVRAGFGFVETATPSSEGFGRDVLVPAGMESGARHGDEVEIEVVRRDPRRRRAVGRIVRVVGRAHDAVLGTLERHGTRWLLVPLNDLDPPLGIDGPPPRPDQDGLVALVRLSTEASPARPSGTVERILGSPADAEVQFFCIAYEHGIRTEFPPAVIAAAAALPADPDPRDAAARRDLRDLPFVTIDGETARDFDDAVCLAAEPGALRLWVAIADVAHYVQPASALDAEAAVRGTSVYFPDRAVPMLPPQLSTELCSLNPGRDRLVIVCELGYDRTGRRRSAHCYRAVMRSRARLTYTAVAAVLSATDTPALRTQRTGLGELLPMLERMRALMLHLYEKRVRAGSLDLDLPEALLDLSETGRAVGVRLEQRNDAHRIIEEFMLEANRAVAAHLRDHDVPLPYRIHEPPKPEDIDELNELLAPFGFAVEYDGRVTPPDVQRLLGRLEGHPLGRVLSRQVLRALTQARYSPENAGHFGLAFPIYCHFTSPIRRYPDLLVHRQLGRLLDGEAERARDEGERLESLSDQSSKAEREAMQAERDMVDLKKCEFMLDHLLEEEPGTVVSVTAAGLFVELDAFPVEGLVRADDLPGDRWYFIEDERALKGMRTRQRFRLGDRVVVEATDVSLRRRQIDFGLVRRLGQEEPHREGRQGSQRKRGRRRG